MYEISSWCKRNLNIDAKQNYGTLLERTCSHQNATMMKLKYRTKFIYGAIHLYKIIVAFFPVFVVPEL